MGQLVPWVHVGHKELQDRKEARERSVLQYRDLRELLGRRERGDRVAPLAQLVRRETVVHLDPPEPKDPVVRQDLQGLVGPQASQDRKDLVGQQVQEVQQEPRGRRATWAFLDSLEVVVLTLFVNTN